MPRKKEAELGEEEAAIVGDALRDGAGGEDPLCALRAALLFLKMHLAGHDHAPGTAPFPPVTF